MFLKPIDLTTALRPAYLPDEVLLFVQDNVGLYEGPYKLPDQQNGQVYLTSHRVCYVDRAAPRKHSVALDLKDVERHEFYAGFLKSSAKITLVPKPTKRGSLQPPPPPPRRPPAGQSQSQSQSLSLSLSRRSVITASPLPPPPPPPPETAPPSSATWVCPICSFSNPVPANFDPGTANAHTPLPPCLACGIKPSLTHVLKASISNATSRQASAPSLQIPLPLPMRPRPDSSGSATATATSASSRPDPDGSFPCRRCTFLNHPSLLSCEMCGAPLLSQDLPTELGHGPSGAAESPGPVLHGSLAACPPQQGWENADSVKLSFRRGGEKIFHERLKGAMTQRKWLLQGAPPIPGAHDACPIGDDPASPGAAGPASGERVVKMAGIAGLERRGQAQRKNNELVIGSAFEDLEALMARAREVVALAETFAQTTSASSSASSEHAQLAAAASQQLGLVTTRDLTAGGGDLYLSELARTLAEFLTDDARGVLRRAGGIVALPDLWALFNRARGGVELVSPADLERAVRLWDQLRLPLRLRTFRSGVMVVQGADRTDEATCRSLLAWLATRHEAPPPREVAWDWREFGRGVTAQDAAERFGWSLGVAEEELEMAEEKGLLCREEGIEGLKFWENFIDTGEGRGYKNPEQQQQQQQQQQQERLAKALQDSGHV
ncbi:hypothetical protein P8C59_002989 [Phyllachora maydis]|uniref:Vacuolar protein-sorting-associated protein 36 n=1 Tax=Phyllachora maydis TaxID=1825666 RepID=A0AAD9HZB9_9PEZI|nr:hypothetical protein P8C59_002989 [Phyllachora maydis]